MRPLQLSIPFALTIPSLALASEFSDFRIPEHRWQTLSVRADAWGYRSHESGTQYTDSRRNVQGALGTDASWAIDADSHRYLLSLSAAAGGGRDRSSFESVFDAPSYWERHDDDSESRDVSERWGLAAELRRFPWRAPFGVLLRGRGFANYAQSWSNESRAREFRESQTSRRSESARDEERWTYLYFFQGDISLGHGRVRDATSVQWTRFLEARLLETGAIRAPLSRLTREKIAALFYLRPSLGAAHDRPDRFFWRELERLLREDPSVDEERLDAFTWLRADEPYVAPRASFLRQSGHFVGLLTSFQGDHGVIRWTHNFVGADFQDDTLVSRFSGTFSEHERVTSDAVMLGAEAEFHLPAGLRWQVDVDGRLLASNRDFPHTVSLTSNAGAGYLVADRWAVSVSQTRFYSKNQSLPPFDRLGRWQASYGISVGFFAEDRVLVQLSASEAQGRWLRGGYGEPVPSLARYSRDAAFSLGLTYRFVGALQAPGLIEPMHLLPLGGEPTEQPPLSRGRDGVSERLRVPPNLAYHAPVASRK